VTFVEGDITNPDDLDKACDDATAIVHLATLGSVPRSIEFPLATRHTNATSTLQVLQAAKRGGDLYTKPSFGKSRPAVHTALPATHR